MKKLFQNKISSAFKSSLLIFFIVTVCLICGKLFFSKHTFFIFDHAAFIVSSSSMEPEYSVNTLIIVRKIDFSSVEIGDVIAFRSNALGGDLAFHRVVDKNENGVYTKGDNNNSGDNQLITTATFVGKGTAKITFFADYIATIKTIRGFVLFLLLPIVSIIICCNSIGILKSTRKRLWQKN